MTQHDAPPKLLCPPALLRALADARRLQAERDRARGVAAALEEECATCPDRDHHTAPTEETP